jgi:predicted ester cyclase
LVFDAFPDITFRPVRHTFEAARSYVEFRAIGTHRREFLNVPPTGTVVIVSGVFNLECDDNSVRCLRLTIDFGGLRRQLLLAARMT